MGLLYSCGCAMDHTCSTVRKSTARLKNPQPKSTFWIDCIEIELAPTVLFVSHPDRVPSYLLQYRLLDDSSAPWRCPLLPLPVPGDPHLPGGPILGAADRSRLHLATGQYPTLRTQQSCSGCWGGGCTAEGRWVCCDCTIQYTVIYS